MDERQTVPIYYLEGNSEKRGVQYGSQAKTLIGEQLELYCGFYKETLNVEWEKVLEAAKRFVPAIKKVNPRAIDQMRGIAKGSGRSFEEILVLNVRMELAYSMHLPHGAKQPVEECVAMVATPEVTLNGHMIIGKNVEVGPPMDRTNLVLLKEKRTDGIGVVAFEQEAGVIGRAGINAAGLGSVGTALWTQQMTLGVPTQVLCNKLIYESKTVAEVLLSVASAERASSSILLTASADGTAIMLEIGAPKAYNCILPEDGLLIGSLFCTVDNPDMQDQINSIFPGGRDFYRMRIDTIRRLLLRERGHITVGTLKKVLRDHTNAPASVCIHSDSSGPTGSHALYSYVMDLTAKTMEVAKGPPCQNEYVSVDLSDVL
jgi:isopenicillin-N N-acyltransferase-like protein